MIQRIQTVYLLLSVILLVLCGMFPIATISPDDVSSPSLMYNMCIIDGNTGKWSFSVVGLLLVLIYVCVITVFNIFGFKNRKRQMSRCVLSMVLLVIWLVGYIVICNTIVPEGALVRYEYPAVLPFIAILLQWLARNGIKHDEELIRAADRIR